MSDGSINNISDKFREKLAARRAAQEPANKESETVTSVPTEDIPDIEQTLHISPEQQAIDQAIASIGIVEAYDRWSNKTRSNKTVRTEGTKVSCPHPDHSDDTASAWFNTEKQVICCAVCPPRPGKSFAGFDRWDLAAFFYSYPVPHYQNDAAMFRELRERVATELGYKIVKGLTQTFVVKEEPETEPTETPATAHTGSTVGAVPASIADETEKEELASEKDGAEVDWRSVLSLQTRPYGRTFLDEWMDSTTQDSCPETFHFWTGLMALGFAVGRHRTLWDQPQVVPNIFVCLVGPSGAGKSRAKYHLTSLLDKAVPFKNSDPLTTGTKLAGGASSGEVFIKMFERPIVDPSDPKRIMGYAPVRGYVDYAEMSDLVAKSSRLGSSLRTTLMDAYDAPATMSTSALGSGTIRAEKPFAQVMTTTQNKSINGLITAGDDAAGFINRWVFATGKTKTRQVISTVQVDLTKPAERLSDIWKWSIGSQIQLKLEPDAAHAFGNLIENQVWPAQAKLEQHSAMLNRMDLLLKKLLVLLAVNEKLDSIPLHIVQMVEKIYPYLLSTYGVVYEALGTTTTSELQDQIKQAILRFTNRNKQYPSNRDIGRAIPKRFRGDLKAVRDNLQVLVQMGEVNEIAPEAGTRGRPAVRYSVAL